ncbi:MAG: long-chain fatty acid--CoA ligase [Planctomycetales bacterium]|nr:long-chain fatty acid--CoA ligase [Planctomycetales bacterium]
MSSKPQTIAAMAWQRLAQPSEQPALFRKHADEFQATTWQQLAVDVLQTVDRLHRLGIKVGDRVAQLSENRYEWIVADLAIHFLRAIHVPIHAPLAPPQVLFQIQHSQAKAVLISNQTQFDKLTPLGDKLPDNLHVILFEPVEHADTLNAVQLNELAGSAESGRNIAQRNVDTAATEDIASILYTSGTTGEPKGVILTHRNLVSNAISTVEAFGMNQHVRRLCFLPLSHIFARTCDLYTWLAAGCELALATSRDTVLADCQLFQPTEINGVPYFYDRVWRILKEHSADQTPGALKQILGSKIHHCCSGGAALPDHVFDYYQQQGVPIYQGYGLSETSPVISLSTPNAFRRSASGTAIKDVQVRLAEDGEILTKGPHVMPGYWHNDQATAEVIQDGWFSTGDYGHIDDDGFIFITGRKKELIVTAAGKNVAPVLLESLLTEDSLIDQAMVIGDGRSFLTALVVPNSQLVSLHHDQHHTGNRPSECEACRAYMQDIVNGRLECVSYHEQVRKITLLSEPFSIEKAELTPKLSLRREVIQQHFADAIEAMYRKSNEGE